MKKVSINIEYYVQQGEYLILEEGRMREKGWISNQSVSMVLVSDSLWSISLNLPIKTESIQFRFSLKKGEETLRKEYGKAHSIVLPNNDCEIKCLWQDEPQQKYFNTSIFHNSIFKHIYSNPEQLNLPTRLIVDCVHIEQSQELVICGEGNFLGDWEMGKSISLTPFEYRKWGIDFSEEDLNKIGEYKFAIRNKETKELIEWEDGNNRNLAPLRNREETTIIELSYRKKMTCWKASGVVIPIFSLRSACSLGIGEFSDLKLMIDWAAKTKMRVIQTLPINDTTVTYSRIDSYPYNAISIYALHPIYLGMSEYSLKDKEKLNKYIEEGKRLNQLSTIDYDSVIRLKTSFQQDLYNEIGEQILISKEFKDFFRNNEAWLFPYACFCYFRDKYQTARFYEWQEFATYNRALLEKQIATDNEIKVAVRKVFFIQYLLHKQLKDAKEYAYLKGITLKGDIPIGISPNSVEAWTEPHLFNMDSQTGAPPDNFSTDGQNWGFPTYNWTEMAKDDYAWWRKRFAKMTDYFDAYRIDHILGFFRIWEIPQTSVNGLLGYFSPALPLSSEEINSWGYPFNEQRDTIASIHKDDLKLLFGKYSEEVVNKYLSWNGNEYFILNKEVNTQRKIQIVFDNLRETEKNKIIREGLYKISCEVLFIKYKHQASKFHPRISLQKTLIYKKLNHEYRSILNTLHNHFFYQKHTEYWRDEAMRKLPTLINSTDMLVCGEDLGMVPDCVPSVMKELEILSLEIQRMPKQQGYQFGFLDQAPYLSVLTTSTHDMSPIRLWWKEDSQITQDYFQSRLYMHGTAPKDCNTLISYKILADHLHSPAMLTIFPLQDWLSISDKLKREKPEEERINIPSDPKHYWNYRMHLTLEKLLTEEEFSEEIRLLNQESGR